MFFKTENEYPAMSHDECPDYGTFEVHKDDGSLMAKIGSFVTAKDLADGKDAFIVYNGCVVKGWKQTGNCN